ncbi:MAG: hypothetical protein HQK79_23290 [Desulfobacterales bacterium]|nr:hypothetical protein [Desulfobacterales bacterium]
MRHDKETIDEFTGTILSSLVKEKRAIHQRAMSKEVCRLFMEIKNYQVDMISDHVALTKNTKTVVKNRSI